jgi:hypothetical protein
MIHLGPSGQEYSIMTPRNLHVVHLLIRHQDHSGDQVRFLVYPHEHWKNPGGQPYLALPAKKTVRDPLAPFLQGTPLDHYVEQIVGDELQVQGEAYALEGELQAVHVVMPTPAQPAHALTHYTIFPLDLWVDPAGRANLCARVKGQWLTCAEAVAHPQISPTAKRLFEVLPQREHELDAYYGRHPQDEKQQGVPRRLLQTVPDRPSMDALALKWLGRNLSGVRHLDRATLDKILDAGSRAFNLRVADPYLRYQMQGVGFTWSFFTDKDPQDCHVHGAPVVEIYGILEGDLEIWWKAYYDRGTAAWSHRILHAGDWLEVDSLQCHIVHWLTPGKGVVFKAGPGPLAEVGKLGVKGKTPCTGCTCMKPSQVRALEPKKPASPPSVQPAQGPYPDSLEDLADVLTKIGEKALILGSP